MRLRLRRTITVAILGVALVVALASSGCALVSLPRALSGVIEPSIAPAASERGSRQVVRDFTFEDSRITLTVPVDQAVYVGSINAEKSAIFLGGANPSNWVGDYYRAFIAEKHQSAFYTELVDALHQARRQKHLDSSRYVELVTSMVQEMEYRTDPVSLAPKFPIETFGDGYGDCDDKTLLAAAVLSRDGYDVAILLFSPEKHVALGIRAPGLEYEKTGYAYVEMTTPSLVGIPPEKLAGNIRLTSQPDVIRIGDGTSGYTAGPQIEYIERGLRQIRADEARMNAQISAMNTDLNSRRSALQMAKQTIQNSANAPQAYAAAVQRFNDMVRQYNDLVGQVGTLVDRYNSFVNAERFVIDHQTARPEVYQRVRDLNL